MDTGDILRKLLKAAKPYDPKEDKTLQEVKLTGAGLALGQRMQQTIGEGFVLNEKIELCKKKLAALSEELWQHSSSMFGYPTHYELLQDGKHMFFDHKKLVVHLKQDSKANGEGKEEEAAGTD